MVPLASHALCDSHTSKASNTKDAILQAEPPDNALARAPNCLYFGVRGRTVHPPLTQDGQSVPSWQPLPAAPEPLRGTVTGMPLSEAQVARTLLLHR